MVKRCQWNFYIRRDSLWWIHPAVVTHKQQRMSFAEKMSFSVLIFPLYIMMKGILPYRDNTWVLKLKCQPGCGNNSKIANATSWGYVARESKTVTVLTTGCVSKRCFEWCKMWGKQYTTCFRSSRIKLYYDSC